jgi:hypothetical protein
MLALRPSLSQAPIVAATDHFATSAFAQSEAEPMALAAPCDGPAAAPMAEKAWLRGPPNSIGW